MKKFLKPAWIIFSIILLVLFTISCFSAFISPLSFSYITFFALAFPYLFLSTLIVAVISLYIRKKLGLIMLICLPPGLFNLTHVVAFNIPKKFDDKKDDKTLRILTWNVEDFVNLSSQSEIRSSMLHIITEKKPDVLCIQELTDVEGGKWRISVRRELDSLGYKFHFFSNDEVTTNKNDKIVTRGSAIFSKTPFTDSGRINIRNDNMHENLEYVDANFDNRILRIYTAHLASFQLYVDTDNIKKDVYEITYDRKKVIQYQLRETEKLHAKEAEIIRDTISKAVLPVIYCGDMNAVPCSYTYHLIKTDLQDAFLEAGCGIGTTFYKIPLLRIDYCLADQRFNITNCTVIKQKLSDHYPVVTDLQWK